MSVAEIEVMESGVFVFISMLVVRGQIIDRWSDYRPDLVPRELGSILVFRKVYKFESTAQMRDIVRISRWPNAILPMVPSDGYVQVHRGFDYRFKEVQTVDLDVDEGTGRDRHGTDMVRNLSRLIPQGINENEFAVNKDLTLTWIRSRADEKLHADSTEVIDSILSCAVGDPVSRSLLDLEALSFEMRRMVYDAANTALALSRTRTIVSVGTGRFQEWREMDFKNNLYICVDPELDTSILRGVKIIEPDLDNLIPVIRRTANKQTGVIAVRMPFEDFVQIDGMTSCLSRAGCPILFSFSATRLYDTFRFRMCTDMFTSVFACGVEWPSPTPSCRMSLVRQPPSLRVRSGSRGQARVRSQRTLGWTRSTRFWSRSRS
jgi:hypothetical protein